MKIKIFKYCQNRQIANENDNKQIWNKKERGIKTPNWKSIDRSALVDLYLTFIIFNQSGIPLHAAIMNCLEFYLAKDQLINKTMMKISELVIINVLHHHLFLELKLHSRIYTFPLPKYSSNSFSLSQNNIYNYITVSEYWNLKTSKKNTL